MKENKTKAIKVKKITKGGQKKEKLTYKRKVERKTKPEKS